MSKKDTRKFIAEAMFTKNTVYNGYSLSNQFITTDAHGSKF